ncbi:MAG: tetratricopeptide repeat protein [Candidatus Roizmanbacteria bacterium]
MQSATIKRQLHLHFETKEVYTTFICQNLMDSRIYSLQNQAIDAALSKDWTVAVEINQSILMLNPHDTDALLAIAFAYFQLHEYESARKHYKEVLKHEPANPIAQNNLDKIEILLKRTDHSQDGQKKKHIINLEDFIAVLGKTKVTHLGNLGQSDVLAQLHVGEEVYVQIKKRRLELRTIENDYVGVLPDDISKRLMFFLEAGSSYGIYIKSALKNDVEVFIKEVKKGKKVHSFVSFPQNIHDDLKHMMHTIHQKEHSKEAGDDHKNEDDDESDEHADDKTEKNDADSDEDQNNELIELTDIETLANFEEADESFMSHYNKMSDYGDDDDE